VPSISYFVCGTPRAGTSLLTGLLKSTGIAGRPEEYFWRDDMPFWAERWKTSTFADYVAAAIQAGTTPNGVFGAKLMWGYMDDFLGRLRAVADAGRLSDQALIERCFARSAFIWVWRGDVVAQAVSWAKAIQTGIWYDHLGRRPHARAEFDFDQIASLAREASDHNKAWREWFAANDIEPLAIRYEDLVSDKIGTTEQVLSYLGLEARDGLLIVEQTRRQSDALNEEWVKRYNEVAPAKRVEPAGLEPATSTLPASRSPN
jgi:LPS sulfotransferase NodH